MIYSIQTNIGKVRECNEDSYVTFINAERDICFFVVADGMGGYNGGDIASKMVADILKQKLEDIKLSDAKKSENGLENFLKDKIIDALEVANKSIIDYARSNNSLKGMGTTVVVTCIAEGRVYHVHVGDSRLYFIDRNGLEQLTIDHSYVEELVKNGIITREQIKDYPRKNIITMALGSEENFYPEFGYRKLKESDVLLLCTDGLSNKVDDNELLEKLSLLANNDVSQSDVERVAGELIDMALDRGGEDNITISLIVY